MCLVKTPKTIAATSGVEKPTQILRNPFLDGIEPLIKAKRTGMSSLRINRASPPSSPTPAAPGYDPVASAATGRIARPLTPQAI